MAFRNKDRIVSKAKGPSRHLYQSAVANAVRCRENIARAIGHRHRANETSIHIAGASLLDLVKKQSDLLAEWRIFACVPSRKNTRTSTESLNLQSRIVRHRVAAGGQSVHASLYN